ncbi:carboxypeptidase regulatory-like domain-containing protein [Silvibacterium acidisoli]|uniref:carboxypeptidase regulatory-like domain-containing protein n=1 Tax=Acidobacteriaceae bacterium ZG23-2 TaxID=2883246 RepID=UPI00406D0BE3
MRSKQLYQVLCCLWACLFAVTGFAQTVNQSITGQVTDPSGAVIPGAQIIAHNLDTGVDTPTKTNQSGFYRIEYLPIGHYSVSVTASGFVKAALPPFSLEIHQTPTFNVTLQIGSSATTVNVEAAAPILNTSDPTISSTFTSNIISSFPLNGQDFSAITLYMPGSISTSGTSGTTGIERSTYNSDVPNMNGNRSQANNYTLDGIDMNETFNNLIAYSPAPQALDQIQVMTANAPAAYGNVNGGDVVTVLKSGTNQFHGSAYGLVQDYRLNANSWQNNQSGTAINPFSQAQFGGTFGGPIKRDKLFFFVDYLGSRYHTGGIGHASVLTAQERTGDFSDILPASTGYGVQLYDPENNFAPYAGNVVPVLNPVAKYLFSNTALYPLPNAKPTDNLLANNYAAPQRSFKANNQGDIKIEYDPRAADKITGFYSMGTAYDGSSPVLLITFPGENIFPTKMFGTNWVHTFSPQLVNSAHVGFTRIVWIEGLPIDSTGLFGTNGDQVVGISFPNQSYQGFSYQSMGSIVSGLGNPAQNNNGLTDNTYTYIDDLTWQRGLHTITMGIQGERYQNNYPTSNNNGYLGTLTYSGAYTNNLSATDGQGWAPADFVLDRVAQAAATLGSVNVGQRQWRVAGYVQDDWKATPRLTLNIGLRWEFDQPWIEENDKTGNIDLTTGQVQYENHVPVGAPAGSGVCKYAGCYKPNYKQWMPRLGFAWQATDRFVVRGGYGATSFYEGNSSNQRLTSITPFIQAVNATTVAPTAGNAGGPPRSAEQGFSGGVAQYGGTFNVYPQDIQPAYIQEWSLTTEYALTHTLSLQVGYIGEQGQHIEDYGNVNQYLVNGDPTSAPFYNNQYLGVNAIDPSVSIGSSPLLITESRAMMNYNAMQAVLRQRLNHGLEFSVNYTYSKAMTNAVGNYGVNTSGYGSTGFQNYYDGGADYGLAGYDATHNLSFTPVYALPIGRGKQFGNGVNRWVDEAIGGWKLSAVGVIWSGFPATATGPGNNSNSYGNSRPNQYRKIKIRNRSIEHWFGTDPSATDVCQAGVDDGTCAFGFPASNGQGGTLFGTARNGSLRAPDFKNVDMSAFKDFHTYKEQLIGFRFDAFNAFNLVSYGNPNTSVNSTQFGYIAQIQAIRSVERHLQFSLHYDF